MSNNRDMYNYPRGPRNGQNMYNHMGNYPFIGPFPPGPQPPPFPYRMNDHYNNMLQHNYPGFNWQGPGPSRARTRSFHRGSANHRGNRRYNDNNRNNDSMKDICCRCGEHLQNSDQRGIHLCDGGNHVNINIEDSDEEKVPVPTTSSEEEKEEELDARLEKLLSNLKDFMRSKYETVTEALEEYVGDKIDQVNTLHRENSEEKEKLEKLKADLEEKAAKLLKEEKELRENQRRLSRDQTTFTAESKKEKEEISRRWQQLRDEITRMEELHEVQQGRIKLDVGGKVFTTSILTLTKESESMLAAMFSGRHEIKSEPDGSVFIDRDGTHFRHVLNYLRDGGVNMECLPRSRQLLRELRKEAVYYQLHGLIQQVEKCL